MQIDFSAREVTLKLVYYGPALSGKTTNLQSLHAMSKGSMQGRLMTLETRDDRTLFFDLLPFAFKGDGDVSVRVKLFTVPGQAVHASTRRLVLQGADGVAFIADSQLREARANAEAFRDLRENLKLHGFQPGHVPTVIQFNKRDLPGVRPQKEIVEQAQRGKEPVFTAIAMRGEGVLETFLGLFFVTWRALEASHGLEKKFGLVGSRLLAQVVQQLGVSTDPEKLLRSAICARGFELVAPGAA